MEIILMAVLATSVAFTQLAVAGPFTCIRAQRACQTGASALIRITR